MAHEKPAQQRSIKTELQREKLRGIYRAKLAALLGSNFEVKDEKIAWRIYKENIPVGGVDVAQLNQLLDSKTATSDPALELLSKRAIAIKHAVFTKLFDGPACRLPRHERKPA